MLTKDGKVGVKEKGVIFEGLILKLILLLVVNYLYLLGFFFPVKVDAKGVCLATCTLARNIKF